MKRGVAESTISTWREFGRSLHILRNKHVLSLSIVRVAYVVPAIGTTLLGPRQSKKGKISWFDPPPLIPNNGQIEQKSKIRPHSFNNFGYYIADILCIQQDFKIIGVRRGEEMSPWRDVPQPMAVPVLYQYFASHLISTFKFIAIL